jgi:hypothetical protein
VTAFTRLGSGVWDWAPFVELDDTTRILWLALYTTAEAKRHAPGLWQGGIPTMADAARMRPDVVVDALDALLAREMVEYDPKTRVLRMTMLPDPGEYPSNGKVILSWWTRFRSVPECGVRDAHIPTLRWIIDTGARLSGKGVTVHHENAWRDTFGAVPIPVPRRRGVRRLADSDTSTHIQPSLFGSVYPEQPFGNGIPSPMDNRCPQGSAPSVDNSAVLRQSNKITGPETVSDTVSDTNRIPDPGSRIPDLSPSLSGGGGGGAGHDAGMRPALALVPPYTAGQVLRELAQGHWDPAFDRTHLEAVGAMIPRWAAAGMGITEFGVLAQYNALKQRRWSARALLGCDIVAEVECARRTIDWRDAQVAAMSAKLS